MAGSAAGLAAEDRPRQVLERDVAGRVSAA